jgi:hypothetical protein
MRRFLLWVVIAESLAGFAVSLYILYHFEFLVHQARESRMALPELTIWMIRVGYPLNAFIPLVALVMPWAAWWPSGAAKVSHVLLWLAVAAAGVIIWLSYLSIAMPLGKIT